MHRQFGSTGLRIPPVVFGTSCLGNLYDIVPDATKSSLVSEYIRSVPSPAAVDSAGKYGAGLALEVLGRELAARNVSPDDVLISNKLGWYRVPLTNAEPTFEPGAWKGLMFDAEQRISADGIIQCYEQGCRLLGNYRPSLVSVHDPDEYLAAALDEKDKQRRWNDILGAYRSLFELKKQGKVNAVGIGSKDWKVIRSLTDAVPLDWVMFAVSFTILEHPKELIAFIAGLHARGIGMINSAVFHAGFLTGGKYFDYRVLSPNDPNDAALFSWREKFNTICTRFGVTPAAACVQFAMSAPGIASIALNTGNPKRVAENVSLATASIPDGFWKSMKEERLIDRDYPYVE
ncbi:MAG: aldo/keto reductase [Spirochaetota bacterium]